MPKKEVNNNRLICISRSAFFALIEAFIYSKIVGTAPPETYRGLITEENRSEIWARAHFYNRDPRAAEDAIVLEYQADTITRLHEIGYSYRVLDRKDESDGTQMSLFDEQEDEA